MSCEDEDMAHLSPQERQSYTQVFLEIDLNGDGSLNKTELSAVFTRLGYKITRPRLEAIFSALDTDKNGKITLDEFLAAMPGMKPKERKIAKLRRIFNNLDTNRDGVLSPEELSRGLSSGGMPIPVEEIKQLIARVDKNGDGELDYEEFLKLAETLK